MTMAAIPRDGPNLANAHRFLNYLMDPSVSAKFTSYVGFATANTASAQLLDPKITEGGIAFPTVEERKRLQVETADDPETTRAITRLWQKFKTGQ
jgi:putrescine transport system substrate-binding protein